MILKGIKYLFYWFYKLQLINYGAGGAAYGSFVIVSSLLAGNALTLIGFIRLFVNSYYRPSLVIIITVFTISLSYNFVIFIYKSRYKRVVLYYKEKKGKGILYGFMTLLYLTISFALFVLFVYTKEIMK